LIYYCPDYVEVLKDAVGQCNGDKADALEWSEQRGGE